MILGNVYLFGYIMISICFSLLLFLPSFTFNPISSWISLKKLIQLRFRSFFDKKHWIRLVD